MRYFTLSNRAHAAASTTPGNDIDCNAFILLGEKNLKNMIKSEGLRMKFKKKP